MKNIPIIDKSFDLEEALKNDGFKIDEKEGSKVAYGPQFSKYGMIQIVFNFSFLENNHVYPIDMCVCYRTNDSENGQENLYKGLAPTNQVDYDTLMELLFPSPEFIDMIESKYVPGS